MKTYVVVKNCLLLSAMVLASGSLWAQPAPADVPPPPPGGPNGPPEAMGLDPACLDVDGNGRVTAPEFSNGLGPMMKDRFKRLDTISHQIFRRAGRFIKPQGKLALVRLNGQFYAFYQNIKV